MLFRSPLGAVLGRPKSEKIQTVHCENRFFDSRLFSFLELQLALLGPSRPLPGQSCGPENPLLASSWLHFGPILALLASLGALLALSWLHLGNMLAHLGRTWLHLGLSCLHLGPILAPSDLFVVSWWTSAT